MRNFLRRIYRERRRVALVATLAAIAGFLFYRHVPIFIGDVHISYVTAALYSGLVGFSSLVVSLIFPNFRFAMEAFAVSRLLYACVVASFPAMAAFTVQSPLMNGSIVVIGGILVSWGFYSNWFSAQLTPITATTVVRMPRRLSGAQQIAPSEDALRKVAYRPDGEGPRAELHGMIFDPAQRELTIDGDERRMHVRHQRQPWNRVVAAWIDDAFGRALDATPTPAMVPADASDRRKAALAA